MTILLAVLLCAGLFGLGAFLREPRRCGGHCAGCIGACERDAPREAEPTVRRIRRGHLTLEIHDD
jgi:hypothetical protein